MFSPFMVRNQSIAGPTGPGASAGSCLSVGSYKLERLEGLCVEAQSRWVAGPSGQRPIMECGGSFKAEIVLQ